MKIVAICQEYGWTYHEYMVQPSWFIELIEERMIMDAKRSAADNNPNGTIRRRQPSS